MQILHQLATAMLHAERHCASYVLLLTKLMWLHTNKQRPGLLPQQPPAMIAEKQ